MKAKINILIILWILVIVCSDCNTNDNNGEKEALFDQLPSELTNINFNNKLLSGLNLNILVYQAFYNGGGVSIGDVNNDGLEDVYFTGNMVSNRLYLNKGNMIFKDITSQAGVAGKNGPWTTGTTMVDINGDGLLDIYVCRSGVNAHNSNRTNELYINLGSNGDGIPHFKEESSQYGLAATGFSIQAYFFDYDRDGDLDVLLIQSDPRLPSLPKRVKDFEKIINEDNPNIGPRLYRNEDNHFKDVTLQSGIQSSSLSYGLGAGIDDFNNDGWPDVYITNDYFVPDYLYINNGDGTFTDKLRTELSYASLSSMGVDVADINNDGWSDIYTLDMLPKSNYRRTLLYLQSNRNKFNYILSAGFYYQYQRNMLHINNSNNTFSEMGQLAGISNTDWSWAPLFADFNNDGWKDLFVTNGYVHDITNLDFQNHLNRYLKKKRYNGGVHRDDLLHLSQEIPMSHLKNYIYRNNGDLTFEDMGLKWGIDVPSNSNGAAYADLDNDGDLDLVINNIDTTAFIYENKENKLAHHHYLKVKLKGTGTNSEGIGAKVTIYTKDSLQTLEQMPTRGFQSSVSPILHFGVGQDSMIDSLQVVWPSGKEQQLHAVPTDTLLILNEANAQKHNFTNKDTTSPLFKEVKSPVVFQHKEPNFNDFKRQPLMVNPMSFFGPPMTKADVNDDGREDIYVGGGNGQAGKLFIQQENGRFVPKKEGAFTYTRKENEVDAVFFDANGDGAPDLYVANGGYDRYQPRDQDLQDHLFLNDGDGNFKLSKNALPAMLTSTGCVRVSDIDGDGSSDLFVGGRGIPGRYPVIPRSYILLNNGNGAFKDKTAQISPKLCNVGMVTDAKWVDFNDDKKEDLLLVGEWMPVSIFENKRGKLIDKTINYFGKRYQGWWNSILVNDFNHDEKPDFIVGNLGLNSQVQVSRSEPAELYYDDFDRNGIIDPILCIYINGESYPFIRRDQLISQIPAMETHFPTYKSYAQADLNDVFTKEELGAAKHLKANTLKTTYFQSTIGDNGHMKYEVGSLPIEVQSSPIFSMTAMDYNRDGNKDLLLFGNMSHTRIRFGNYESNYGMLLKADGNGSFKYIPQNRSGFKVQGDIRSMLQVNDLLLLGVNKGTIITYKK